MKKSKISKNLQTITIDNKILIQQIQRLNKRIDAQDRLLKQRLREIQRLQKQIAQPVQMKTVKNIAQESVQKHLHDVLKKGQRLLIKGGELVEGALEFLEEHLETLGEAEFADEVLHAYKKIGAGDLTYEQLQAMYNGNKISIFLANNGVSVQEIIAAVAEYGYTISEEYVLNVSN